VDILFLRIEIASFPFFLVVHLACYLIADGKIVSVGSEGVGE